MNTCYDCIVDQINIATEIKFKVVSRLHLKKRNKFRKRKSVMGNEAKPLCTLNIPEKFQIPKNLFKNLNVFFFLDSNSKLASSLLTSVLLDFTRCYITPNLQGKGDITQNELRELSLL